MLRETDASHHPAKKVIELSRSRSKSTAVERRALPLAGETLAESLAQLQSYADPVTIASDKEMLSFTRKSIRTKLVARRSDLMRHLAPQAFRITAAYENGCKATNFK
ncbi:hypothetical protein JVT61DRAFT_12197 [Boletus reticuloceps]|uniref:Uncharacterized protein n=1 Tax=Boletus reticuloceps TaxID=495285 RepID=A0A8I3A373_9AGAM|nr:hypothetical protein JVT61DRAFT_12197 [Boletus reticuloceps]